MFVKRDERLVFCKTCTFKKNDLKAGIICSLTDKIADFENECDDYEADEDEMV